MRAQDLDIDALLDVDPCAGVVRFAGQRSLIVDAGAMGVLRQQLFAALGPAEARAVLTRFGFAHGWRTAEAAAAGFAWDSADERREAGGRLHMLQGILRLDPGEDGPLSPAGATVHGSYEAEQHLLHLGGAAEPVCFTLGGFASGYLSRIEGREIYALEDRCVARGDAACRFTARTAEAWGPALAPHRRFFPGGPEGHALRDKPEGAWPPEHVCESEAMRGLLALAERVARVPSTALITGETGTGKEWLARWIHARSPVADGPFVAVHCAAIPEPLLESELFGHARGAFTGATRDRAGLFETARGGTLLLDEVGDMPPAMQVKLLRALQQREVRRVGEDRDRPVQVRVIAATHRDLAAQVAAGAFRADLYYRLRVVELAVPPLRARGADIVPLARALLARAARRLGRPGLSLGADAAALLGRHAWPGNVRELENAMERAVVLAAGDRVGAGDLPPELGRARAAPAAPRSLQALEREAIADALARHGGCQRAAAAELGISASTLYRRLRRGV